MKLWIDDVRPAPEGYCYCKTVNAAKYFINHHRNELELISIDHDAGDYVYSGGDYIEVLNWMEREGISIPIHIHSMNIVGIQNMRAIIQKNGWKEV